MKAFLLFSLCISSLWANEFFTDIESNTNSMGQRQSLKQVTLSEQEYVEEARQALVNQKQSHFMPPPGLGFLFRLEDPSEVMKLLDLLKNSPYLNTGLTPGKTPALPYSRLYSMALMARRNPDFGLKVLNDYKKTFYEGRGRLAYLLTRLNKVRLRSPVDPVPEQLKRKFFQPRDQLEPVHAIAFLDLLMYKPLQKPLESLVHLIQFSRETKVLEKIATIRALPLRIQWKRSSETSPVQLSSLVENVSSAYSLKRYLLLRLQGYFHQPEHVKRILDALKEQLIQIKVPNQPVVSRLPVNSDNRRDKILQTLLPYISMRQLAKIEKSLNQLGFSIQNGRLILYGELKRAFHNQSHPKKLIQITGIYSQSMRQVLRLGLLAYLATIQDLLNQVPTSQRLRVAREIEPFGFFSTVKSRVYLQGPEKDFLFDDKNSNPPFSGQKVNRWERLADSVLQIHRTISERMADPRLLELSLPYFKLQRLKSELQKPWSLSGAFDLLKSQFQQEYQNLIESSPKLRLVSSESMILISPDFNAKQRCKFYKKSIPVFMGQLNANLKQKPDRILIMNRGNQYINCSKKNCSLSQATAQRIESDSPGSCFFYTNQVMKQIRKLILVDQ